MASSSLVPTRRRLSLDHVGTGVACACAVHCLATPFLVVAFPLAAWLGEGAELALIVLSLGTSTVAMLRGVAVHRQRYPMILLGMAAVALALRPAVGEGWPERGLVLFAAALLVGAHAANLRSLRRRRPLPTVAAH